MVPESSGVASPSVSAHTARAAESAAPSPGRSQRDVAVLSRGSKLSLAIVLCLLMWAGVAVYWPVTVAGATGETLICGNATTSTPRATASCQQATSRQRLLAAGLVGSSMIVGIAGIATFGLNRRVEVARSPSP